MNFWYNLTFKPLSIEHLLCNLTIFENNETYSCILWALKLLFDSNFLHEFFNLCFIIFFSIIGLGFSTTFFLSNFDSLITVFIFFLLVKVDALFKLSSKQFQVVNHAQALSIVRNDDSLKNLTMVSYWIDPLILHIIILKPWCNLRKHLFNLLFQLSPWYLLRQTINHYRMSGNIHILVLLHPILKWIHTHVL